MKIKFSYLPEESELVEKAVANIKEQNPKAKRKDTAKHQLYLHTYLTTEQPAAVAK